MAGAVQAAQAILQPVPPPEPGPAAAGIANPEPLQINFFLAFVRLFSRFMACSRGSTCPPVQFYLLAMLLVPYPFASILSGSIVLMFHVESLLGFLGLKKRVSLTAFLLSLDLTLHKPSTWRPFALCLPQMLFYLIWLTHKPAYFYFFF